MPIRVVLADNHARVTPRPHARRGARFPCVSPHQGSPDGRMVAERLRLRVPSNTQPLKSVLKPVTAVLADDHGLVRAGLGAMLRQLGVEVVGEAESGGQALHLVERLCPDLVLLDIVLPEINGVEAARRIRRRHPDTRVLIVSLYDDEEYVRSALEAGADGYLLKGADADELGEGVGAVMRGETYVSPALGAMLATGRQHVSATRRQLAALTDRQRQVLQMIAEGHSTRDIAHILKISVKTVETHRTQLMKRLDIHDVAGLVRFAIRSGVVTLEP
jgi:DNA-binding NarL/FixJ family response regulator